MYQTEETTVSLGLSPNMKYDQNFPQACLGASPYLKLVMNYNNPAMLQVALKFMSEEVYVFRLTETQK